MTAVVDHAPTWVRPQIAERPDYVPRGDMELFIVPLLKSYIESRLGAMLLDSCGAKVLDIGCGRQPFRSLIESFGCRYFSLDAQQNEDNGVDYIAPIDGELPAGLLDEAPFSLLLCTEVLEHVADWNAAFRNIRRLSTSGTKVLLTCPFFYPLHEEPFDFWRPTLHAIRHFADQNGLIVEEQSRLGDGWDVLGTLLGASPIGWDGESILMRVVYRVVRSVRCRLMKHLTTTGLLRRIRVTNKLYLSNAIIIGCP